MRSTRIPREIQHICCVVQSPNKNFVITYSTSTECKEYKIGVLSSDGQDLIHTCCLRGTQQLNYNPFQLTINKAGQIFMVDRVDRRIVSLNSQLEFQRVDWNTNLELSDPTRVVYVESKQLLLVHDLCFSHSNPSLGTLIYSPRVVVLKLNQINLTEHKRVEFSTKKCPIKKRRSCEMQLVVTVKVPRNS